MSKFEKDLVKSILALWKDLRDLRKKQNFTITGHKLAIHKEAANMEEDKVANMVADMKGRCWWLC